MTTLERSKSFLDRVATAPISWGVCEVPGWGHQLEPGRVLAEMGQLGFTATELGSLGWLPTDRGELASMLDQHQLQLLASFVPLVLHQPDQLEAQLVEAKGHVEFLSAMGAVYFNTAPVTSPDWGPRSVLTDTQWDTLYRGLAAVEEMCTAAGLTQVIHEHVGCVIETADEVQRLIDNTSVRFVLDTGHLVVGGYDPLAFARNHPDRVGLVHLKDTRLAVADRLNDGAVDLMGAVQDGLFPPLGEGDLDIAAVITVLEEAGFDGWYVIEQDCAITGPPPPVGQGPIDDVARSVAYLSSVAEDLADQADSSSVEALIADQA